MRMNTITPKISRKAASTIVIARIPKIKKNIARIDIKITPIGGNPFLVIS
jgi:hypothetical protein